MDIWIQGLVLHQQGMFPQETGKKINKRRKEGEFKGVIFLAYQ